MPELTIPLEKLAFLVIKALEGLERDHL